MALKETVFLPKTDFPMRAKLPEREPQWIEKWEKMDIYASLMKERADAPPFILHDGPPYANGDAHIGHAMNRVLKDFVLRSQAMQGKRTPFVPGWDCHGLPIEWKIEEKYRKDGKSKDDVPLNEFRKECRSFADHWIGIQRAQLKRLGLLGDWEKPYVTMDFENEARILEELGKFLVNGSLVKGFKPVHWSVVEKTALAEAEIEYKDKTSPSIYVAFPLVSHKDSDLKGARCVIWTTTPWTLPANRAIAYGAEVSYDLVRATVDGKNVATGDTFVVASDLKDGLSQALDADFETLKTFEGIHLADGICHHPLRDMGYGFDVPLLPGDHVTTDAGTGLVHTAPTHGAEDFALGQAYNLEVPHTLTDDGVYTSAVPGFEGIHVFKAHGPVMEALDKAGSLIAAGEITHSYPHSWRSKAPLIQRATPQWFIGMKENDLQAKALEAIKTVKWVPAQGEERIRSMVETRPDWCISRQRAWGVPLCLFLHKDTGEVLRDAEIHARIVEAFRKEGSDIWFEGDPCRFLEGKYNPGDYTPTYDILDVWFESGCTHAHVLDAREELSRPADLYLEGSDQHRGWFQSSLLTAVGTIGKAPFKAVLTHGFVLDDKGYKMSKSLGNVVAPQDIVKESGAEMLRLWVAASDYSDDIRVGKQTIQHQQDMYRRLRNTFRYLLGSLTEYDEKAEAISYEQLPELEKWVLHRLHELSKVVHEGYNAYHFSRVFQELHHFCAVDLSAFYFDIRKDAIYCDGKQSETRRGARFVFNQLINHLTRWLAPLLPFTTEEVWEFAGHAGSVHMQQFLSIPDQWQASETAEKIAKARIHRRVITGALEQARTNGLIRSSLEADVTVYDPESQMDATLDWETLAIVSGLSIEKVTPGAEAFQIDEVNQLWAKVQVFEGKKCDRCWQMKKTLTSLDDGHVCNRCHDAVTSNGNRDTNLVAS